jgi:hypothetical protein
MSKVKAGYIYPAKKNEQYSKTFKYWLVCMSGDFWIVDCLPCNSKGYIAPGFNCGIPKHTSCFFVTKGYQAQSLI